MLPILLSLRKLLEPYFRTWDRDKYICFLLFHKSSIAHSQVTSRAGGLREEKSSRLLVIQEKNWEKVGANRLDGSL